LTHYFCTAQHSAVNFFIKDGKMNILKAVIFAANTLAGTLAFGHAGPETKTAMAGTFYKAVLRIPHGCDGAPTDTVRIKIPKGRIPVKPKPKPGWQLETVTGTYQQSYDLHGQMVNEEVIELIWRGYLPADWLGEFVFLGKLSASLAAETPM